MVDINLILDAITILTAICTLFFFLENMFLFFFSWDVTKTWIQMGLFKQPGFIRLGGDNQWHFDLAYVDPMNSKKWYRKVKDEEIPFEANPGAIINGPCKTTLMLIADENGGAAGINVAKLLSEKAIGATPAHVSNLEKTSYTKGFLDAFKKNNPGGLFEWVAQNIQSLAVLFMIGIIGTVVLYDKVISAPGAWNAAQTCEREKAILMGKLAQAGADISDLVSPTTTTTLSTPQQVSGAIVGGS